MSDVLPIRSDWTHKKPQPPKICVALASHDMCHASFMWAMANLAGYSVANLPPEGEFGVTMVKGTYVHNARQQLLEMALKRGVTHVLWIDTDMKFPRDSLLRLLERDLPVVGINYCHRGLPYEFVAIKHVGLGADQKSEKLITAKHSTGVEEVEALGFGMVLMRTDILTCLPSLDVTPWFGFDFIGGRKQVGEDVRFCKFLTDAGHKIYVDHDLSKEIVHIGEAEYDCGMAEMLSNSETVRTLAAL